MRSAQVATGPRRAAVFEVLSPSGVNSSMHPPPGKRVEPPGTDNECWIFFRRKGIEWVWGCVTLGVASVEARVAGQHGLLTLAQEVAVSPDQVGRAGKALGGAHGRRGSDGGGRRPAPRGNGAAEIPSRVKGPAMRPTPPRPRARRPGRSRQKLGRRLRAAWAGQGTSKARWLRGPRLGGGPERRRPRRPLPAARGTALGTRLIGPRAPSGHTGHDAQGSKRVRRLHGLSSFRKHVGGLREVPRIGRQPPPPPLLW